MTPQCAGQARGTDAQPAQNRATVKLNRWSFGRAATIVAFAYALVTTTLAGFRMEPWLLVALCAVFLSLGRRVADLFDRVVPYLVFLTLYDALRYARDAFLTADRVTICGLRSIELSLFGLGSNVTPGEWLQQHHSSLADLVLAAPYFVFAYVVIIYALILYWLDRPRMSRFLWSFALANAIAFVVWVFVPSAPPWYQHAHGCQAELAALPSAAGLLRVDALLNIHYFSSLYGKSTYMFGAWPSLHCTYPMIGLMTAWRHAGWRTRPIHLLYVTWMFCASVYLDHHYLIDGLSGFCLAGLSVYIVSRLSARWSSASDANTALARADSAQESP